MVVTKVDLMVSSLAAMKVAQMVSSLVVQMVASKVLMMVVHLASWMAGQLVVLRDVMLVDKMDWKKVAW